MDRSMFLARLLGPTFVAISLGLLINLGMYESMIAEALHPGISFYLSGLLSLLAGLAMINLHNTWCMDWRVIITVLGWLMTIGGIVRIVVPQVAIVIGSTIYSGRVPTIVAALIIGTLGSFLLQGLLGGRLTATEISGGERPLLAHL